MRRAALVSVGAGIALASVVAAAPAHAVVYGANLIPAAQASMEGTGAVVWSATGATVSRSTSWFEDGAASLAISPTAKESYAALLAGGDLPRLDPGTYRLRGTYQSAYAHTGPVSHARRLVLVGSGVDAAAGVVARTPAASNVANDPATVSVEFTITAATWVDLRAYNGDTLGPSRWDAMSLVTVTQDPAGEEPPADVTVEVPRPSQSEVDAAVSAIGETAAWGYATGLGFVVLVLLVARTSERG